ncbi:MAG: hypothetical protein HKUEN01_04970 [Candidatus Kuenenia stuttgartiensis]|nr:MAG: hypothetical protein HKUEN01_04970 [Candidatus Kuenenia stuttgartiensis]
MSGKEVRPYQKYLWVVARITPAMKAVRLLENFPIKQNVARMLAMPAIALGKRAVRGVTWCPIEEKRAISHMNMCGLFI